MKTFDSTRKQKNTVMKSSTNLFTSALLDSAIEIPAAPLVHARGLSLDRSDATAKLNNPESKHRILKDFTPEKVNRHLSMTSSMSLDPELLKKLRLLLRNESTGWVHSQFFFTFDFISSSDGLRTS
jgi:hypothetical protein